MAPVNPEGQTARDVIEAAKRLARKDYIAWGDAGGPNQCSHNRAAGVPCPWCDLATVVCCDIDKILPAQPSEGQTAQEPKAEWHVLGNEGDRTADVATGDGDVVAIVFGNAAHFETAYQRAVAICAARNAGQTAQEARHRAEALWVSLNRPAMTSNKGIDLIVRALASTPSQIQTQSTKEEHGGRDRSGAAQHRAFSGGGDAEHAGDGTPRFEADRTERQVLRADEQSGVHSVRARAAGVCEADREVAPSPAKQEQKIASAEGAASQLGAAPATRYLLTAAWKDGALTRMEGPREALDDALKWWAQNGEDPATTVIEVAPAQPDARDAEIARLTKEPEEARAAADRRQFTTDEAVRLLNIVLRALAPPEPKAETPAETPITDLAPAMREALARRGYQPAPPSPSPAQPSHDVAGTSGESLAGLSKEGSET